MRIIWDSKKAELAKNLAFLWSMTDVNEVMSIEAKDIIFKNIVSIAHILDIPYEQFMAVMEWINREALIYLDPSDWSERIGISFHEEMERRNKK